MRPDPFAPGDDLALAERLVRFGRSCGADEIEVGIGEGEEFSVDVRMGQIENLVEAGSRYAGIRVIKDKRTAFASSSDMSEEALERLIRNAVKRAGLSQPDPFAGLADLSPIRIDPDALDIFDPEVIELEAKTKIRLALETERIALADKRISNSHGAGFSSHAARTYLAASNGFAGTYAKTFCGLGVGLQAGETDDLVEDDWHSSRIHFRDLESPEQIARTAVERTVRQLNPRKLGTRRVPVIFEPQMTGSLLGFLFGCISGTAVYQRSTFLADRLGQKIGRDELTVIDDGLMPRRVGTGPFDSEGIPAQRTVVVDHGVLKRFLCNTYASRKLGLPVTGNADGGGVGPNNFFLEPGPHDPAAIIRSCDRALLLIRTLGHGLNAVTGDISRGAFGLWIENGEIVYPVSEITIAGNLGDVLQSVEMIGSDLDFRSSIAGPTIKVAEMLVAGS
ncbi:MAG: TldD/PmbA family protein [Candidatus Aminicenantes bacterium]|nr:TldD/PmbA family protein [Candidatus Aminicenantes bacterium]